MSIPNNIAVRLEELRAMIVNEEDISYGELAELQDMADYISNDDYELLQWAGVPEGHETDPDGEFAVCGDPLICHECRTARSGVAIVTNTRVALG